MAGQKNTPQFVLPNRVVTRRDVIETAREFERLRDNLAAQAVEGSHVEVLDPSERARSVMEENNIQELTSETANKLQAELQALADHAPMFRFVFAGEPEFDFLQRLITWIRNELHSSGLILYSIQPQIAGGFILTTDQRRYDHSWRAALNASPLQLGLAVRESSVPAEPAQTTQGQAS